MVLHAWEQYETAAGVYARARALERRYDWFYLGGLVGNAPGPSRRRRDDCWRTPCDCRRGPHPRGWRWPTRCSSRATWLARHARYSSLTTGPGAPHAHYGLGRSLAAKGEKEAALREIEAAVQLFPEFGAAWYAEAMVLRGLGRSAEARKALERAQQFGAAWPSVDDPAVARMRALRDDAGPHMKRGLSLQKQGDVAGAIAEYEAAIAADPQLASAHVNLIALYGRQQDWERAESHYRALERIGPVPAEAHYNFGLCLAAQRKSAEAADMFRMALAVNPEHAGALSSLGQLAELEGRVDEAEASYRSAAAAAPNDPLIRFNIGRMLIARGQFTDAIAQLDPLKSVEHPDRPRFLFGLATAYVLAGHREEGQRYAIQARDLARERGQREFADSIDRDLAKLK